jgi:hypothetical protein
MDPQLLATQERLLSFRTWIENVPGILDSGYFDTSIDVRQLAVTVVWNGTSPLLDLVKKEGLGRGIAVQVQQHSLSRIQMLNAVAKLEGTHSGRGGGRWCPRVAGDGLTERGHDVDVVLDGGGDVAA